MRRMVLASRYATCGLMLLWINGAAAAPSRDGAGRSAGPDTGAGAGHGAGGAAGVISPRGSVDPHMAVKRPHSRPNDMPVIKPGVTAAPRGTIVTPR